MKKKWINPFKKKKILKMIFTRGYDLDGDIIYYKDAKYYVHWFGKIVEEVI